MRKRIWRGLPWVGGLSLLMLFLGCEQREPSAQLEVHLPPPAEEPASPVFELELPETAPEEVEVAAEEPRPDPGAPLTAEEAQACSRQRQDLHLDAELAALFPTPRAILPNVRFWHRVFTEWSSGQYAIHDAHNPAVIYQVVRANHGNEPQVKRAKKRVEQALRRLAKKRPRSARGLRGLERQVYKAWSVSKNPRRFSQARGQVRHQKGQRDRFAKALVDAGRYRDEMEATLSAAKLPPELLSLVFVESMFQLGVRSSAGALGVWQFMPATGREYLNINDVVDERRDPILATQAASSYLRTARARLKSWPLAITSYNYGMNGMARAVKKARTSDLATILRKHKSKRLGFAVKNYYAEFLAAQQVLAGSDACFPHLRPEQLWKYDVVRLPSALTLAQLVEAEAVSRDALADLNPALSREALQGQVRLPRGMTLRVPEGLGGHFMEALEVAGLGPRRAPAAKTRIHVVRRGENVTRIAREHGVSVGAVLAANDLTWDAPIYPDMRLRIPASGSGTTAIEKVPVNRLD